MTRNRPDGGGIKPGTGISGVFGCMKGTANAVGDLVLPVPDAGWEFSASCITQDGASSKTGTSQVWLGQGKEERD